MDRVVCPAEWLVWRQVAAKYKALAPKEFRKRLARMHRRDPVMAEGVRRIVGGYPLTG